MRQWHVYLLELVGEDDRFSIAEAAMAAAEVTAEAPGIAVAAEIDRAYAVRLARTRAISESLFTVEGSLETLCAEVRRHRFTRSGTVAVRARDVRGAAGISRPEVERTIGDILVERGFEVDLETPDHVLRILATGQQLSWYVGWLAVEPPRSYGSRRPPERPFRQPGTMRPQLARTLVNLTGVRSGQRLLDPMCGAGAILVEAALVGTTPVGVDLQRKMVEGTRANLAAFAPDGPQPIIVQGSASSMPICEADVAVFDAPYGRQSPIGYRSSTALVAATLGALKPLVDRCVAVFDRPIEDEAERMGWTVRDRFDRRVHRSLTRYVTVLEVPGLD